MGTHRVAILGQAFLDTIVYLPVLPTKPTKIRATDVIRTGGGIAATAAYAAARLGARPIYWGRLGRDTTAEEILARLTAAGVDTADVRLIGSGRSPVGTVLVDPDGERMAFGFIGRGLEDDGAWLPLDRLDGLGAVMADYSWKEGAARLFEAARRRGIVSVMDADVGDMGAVHALLGLPDHIVFSAACLAQLTGTDDIGRGLAEAQARAGGTVAVTRGAAGFYWLDGGRLAHVPAFPVKAVDTNGAGDIFHGAYTVGLAEGRDVAGAARLASATAALKCARGSGWESIPDRADVETLLTTGDTDEHHPGQVLGIASAGG
jgi:sulfofructose kinase